MSDTIRDSQDPDTYLLLALAVFPEFAIQVIDGNRPQYNIENKTIGGELLKLGDMFIDNSPLGLVGVDLIKDNPKTNVISYFDQLVAKISDRALQSYLSNNNWKIRS